MSFRIFTLAAVGLLLGMVGGQIFVDKQQDARTAALEKLTHNERAAFHGFLYTFNGTTWDRVRTNDIEVCRSAPCSVFLYSGDREK